jgi:radical SAM-linked protein
VIGDCLGTIVNRNSAIFNSGGLGPMTGDKLRFRFAKTGHLRLLSHHDLMRCLERMLRRADVPFKSTAGFHPTPRVVFALSLPLGVVGRDEAVEVELTRPCAADETLGRLNAQAPDGLSFTRVSVVPMKATAIPRRVVYRLWPLGQRDVATRDRCEELLRADKIWVDRLRPTPKRLNIRPYIRSLLVDDGVLTLDLWVTQTGTARADELVRLLNLSDLLEAGAVLHRDVLELRDEVTHATDNPPDGPADTLPLDPAAVAAPVRDEEANQPAAAHWGASPNGPVVE